MRKINIRESLLNMDRETNCQYDLTSLYEACKLDDKKKSELVKYIDAYDFDATNRFLSNEAASQGLMENTSDDMIDEDFSKYAIDEDVETFNFNDEGDEATLDEKYVNGKWEPEFGPEWKEEDIALWKSIDWKARNYERYVDETDTFEGEVVAYSADEDPKYATVTFAKELSANPIYSPAYKPTSNPFEGTVGFMYDGTKHNGYMVMDRTETQEVYDMMFENLNEAAGDIFDKTKRIAKGLGQGIKNSFTKKDDGTRPIDNVVRQAVTQGKKDFKSATDSAKDTFNKHIVDTAMSGKQPETNPDNQRVKVNGKSVLARDVKYVKQEKDGKTTIINNSRYNNLTPQEKAKYTAALQEDILDDSDYEPGVEAGKDFFEDGKDFAWMKRHGDVYHLDFDNWAVWEAFCHDDGEMYYFVVDEDSEFVDWGPVDTVEEAQEFLQSKVNDWENDDLDESKSIKENLDRESMIKAILLVYNGRHLYQSKLDDFIYDNGADSIYELSDSEVAEFYNKVRKEVKRNPDNSFEIEDAFNLLDDNGYVNESKSIKESAKIIRCRDCKTEFTSNDELDKAMYKGVPYYICSVCETPIKRIPKSELDPNNEIEYVIYESKSIKEEFNIQDYYNQTLNKFNNIYSTINDDYDTFETGVELAMQDLTDEANKAELLRCDNREEVKTFTNKLINTRKYDTLTVYPEVRSGYYDVIDYLNRLANKSKSIDEGVISDNKKIQALWDDFFDKYDKVAWSISEVVDKYKEQGLESQANKGKEYNNKLINIYKTLEKACNDNSIERATQIKNEADKIIRMITSYINRMTNESKSINEDIDDKYTESELISIARKVVGKYGIGRFFITDYNHGYQLNVGMSRDDEEKYQDIAEKLVSELGLSTGDYNFDDNFIVVNITNIINALGLNESKSINESADTMIYLFPELTDEDVEMAKAYGLQFIGYNHGPDGEENNWVMRGTEASLNRFADKYLGYELHPAYLYYEDDFAGDIVAV